SRTASIVLCIGCRTRARQACARVRGGGTDYPLPRCRSAADPSRAELEFRKVQLKRAVTAAEKDAEIAHSERALEAGSNPKRGRVMARHTQQGGVSNTARARRKSRAGFSLVEIVVAGLVLAIAVCGMSGSMVSAVAVNRVNR